MIFIKSIYTKYILLFFYVLNMLTDKQQKVLDIITEFFSKYGKSPTIEELQDLLNQKSKRWVIQYLESLEKKWFITRESSYRWIKLWNSVWFQTMLMIPFLWYANAWKPLCYADEQNLWIIPISKKIISWDEKNYFLVKVEWTSMNQCKIKDKYIENWSYVLIDKTKQDISKKEPFLFVVWWTATIKVPKKEQDYLYLVPQSSDNIHKPIILSWDDEFYVNWQVIDVFNF